MERSVHKHRTHRHGREILAMEIEWRSSGQTTGGNTGLNNRPTENRSWRNNSQPTYQVRNMEINEMEPEDEIEEERA